MKSTFTPEQLELFRDGVAGHVYGKTGIFWPVDDFGFIAYVNGDAFIQAVHFGDENLH